MNNADKVLENLRRRQAARRGQRLIKSNRRDPAAFDYNRWLLVTDTYDNPAPGATDEAVRLAFAHGEGLTLDEVAAILSAPLDDGVVPTDRERAS